MAVEPLRRCYPGDPDERLLRQAEESVDWYYQESKADQSGLRSVQAATAARLEMAGGEPPRGQGPDGRQLAQVRRARRIEGRLGRMDPYGAGVLATVHRGRLFELAPAFGRAAGVAPDLVSVCHEYGRLHPDSVAGVTDVAGWMVQISRRFLRNASSKPEKSFVRRTRHECLRIYIAALMDYVAA